MSISKRIALSLGVAALLIATMLVAGWILERTESEMAGSGVAKIGGPFQLTDHTGKSVSDADFRGKYLLVYFGYSYCPDVCPTELATMGAALDMLGDAAREVVPIFVTVDPVRDTPEHLALYVDNFHERMVGLTGTEQQIAHVTKEFRIYYRKVEDAASSDYVMDHSSIVYMMGRDGKYVTHFSHGTSAEDMARRLKELI